jgi:serine/threonine-protein kinase
MLEGQSRKFSLNSVIFRFDNALTSSDPNELHRVDPLSAAEARRERVKDLFCVLADVPPPDWELLLDSDPSLTSEERSELRRLLNAKGSEAFFEDLSKAIGSLATVERAFIPGDTVAGRFRVLRFLGSGGMGDVYAVDDQELRCEVALKVLHSSLALRPEFIDRFRSEIRLSRHVANTHVCRVFDVARHITPGRRDIVFYTMELLPGETLSARIRQVGKLPDQTAREVSLQLMEGMRAAHGCRVMHCDFKSGNVMLCGPDSEIRAVITDFGLARPLQIEPRSENQIKTEDDVFTPAYASPEQHSRQELTVASDVFSLGIVLYELITGERPSRQDDGTLQQPIRLANCRLGSQWEQFVLRCLAPDPGARPSDLDKALRDLRAGPSRRWFIAAAAAASVAVPAGLFFRNAPTRLPSIAVRPFGSDAAEHSKDLADATANRIADLLTKLPGLRVVSLSLAASSAAEERDVDYLIVGSVKAKGSGFEMHLELATRSGTAVWSQTRTGQVVQLESMYREAVLTVAQRLNLEGNGVPAQTVVGNVPAEAYQNYLLARYHAENRDVPSIRQSIRQLEEALRVAPGFAAAHAWMGMCYYLLTAEDKQNNRVGLHQQAGQFARKALELDPQESDAHVVLGLNDHLHNFDWRGAEDHFRRAIERAPSRSLPRYRLARLLSDLTRHDEALGEMEQASSLDFSSTIKIGWGMVLLAAGKATDSIAELETLAGTDPGHFNLYVPLSSAYCFAGRMREALEAATHACVKSAEATDDHQPMSFALGQLGYMHARMGHADEARGIQNELERRYLGDTADAGEVALVPAGFQNADDTILWLERGYLQRSVTMPTLRSDYIYKFMSDNEAFQRLLFRLQLLS